MIFQSTSAVSCRRPSATYSENDLPAGKSFLSASSFPLQNFNTGQISRSGPNKLTLP